MKTELSRETIATYTVVAEYEARVEDQHPLWRKEEVQYPPTVYHEFKIKDCLSIPKPNMQIVSFKETEQSAELKRILNNLNEKSNCQIVWKHDYVTYDDDGISETLPEHIIVSLESL